MKIKLRLSGSGWVTTIMPISAIMDVVNSEDVKEFKILDFINWRDEKCQ